MAAVGSSGLLLVGRIDPIELAQQSRPFELGWFITAADGAIIGGADDLVGDRVEGGARLLERRAASPPTPTKASPWRSSRGPAPSRLARAGRSDQVLWPTKSASSLRVVSRATNRNIGTSRKNERARSGSAAAIE